MRKEIARTSTAADLGSTHLRSNGINSGELKEIARIITAADLGTYYSEEVKATILGLNQGAQK